MNKYITYNDILFLHTQETYEVRKGQTVTIQIKRAANFEYTFGQLLESV